MVRSTLSLAAIAFATIFLSGCASGPIPPTTTIWNKMGIPQAYNAARANMVNRRGNHPQWEKKPLLKNIADPANLESPNPAIKAAAEIKAEEDLAPQKIKALKYLATIGCGCYDKEGKVEAAILAGLNDCTEEVRKTAAETVLTAAGECQCHDGCASTCCTEKIQEKLQDMAYGETDGCWHEPSAEVRQIAMSALSACPPISVEGNNRETLDRETVPTPALPEREVSPGAVPTPPAVPMDAAAPIQNAAEVVTLTSTSPEAASAAGNYYAPLNIEQVAPVAPIESKDDSATSQLAQATAILIDNNSPPVLLPKVESEQVTAEVAAQPIPESVETKIEFVISSKSLAVMHMPKAAQVQVGEVLNVQIHSRRGDHTIDGKLAVTNIDGSLVYVRPVDGLALKVMRPGSSVTISR